MVSPSRSRENGRQPPGLSTRSASHPFMNPTTIEASLPPATAMSTIPERIMCAACPMAWLDEAQADAIA